MPRKSFQSNQQTEEINISPLIDMVFILLIFFIVTTTFVDERGFEASKPDTASQSESDIEPVVFLITKNGDVIHQEENIGIGGVGRIVRNNLAQGELPVIVQVENEARAEVALKVFDQALQAGASAVNLAQVNQ